MIHVSLQRLVLKNEVNYIISQITGLINTPVFIQDAEGMALFGEIDQYQPFRYPVEIDNKTIGWVGGGEQAAVLASLLSCLAKQELEKKSIGREALEKYKEITLLYDLAEKLTASLDTAEVAQLVIDEAKTLIAADNNSVMLVNEETGMLEVIASSGKELHPGEGLKNGTGIAGSVVLTGRAEIVNDIPSDKRYVPGAVRVSSLMCAPLKIKDRVIGVIYISSEDPVQYTAEDLKLLSAIAFQAAADIENARLYDSLKETFLTTVYTLAETIEKRDPYTGGHTKRVMNYSIAIGKVLGLSDTEIGRLELAAMLHDIGKIGIKDRILLKKGKLTPFEFAEIKMHPIYAEEILNHIKHLRDIVPAVKHHHERYDGCGYPEKLRGDGIDIKARIIAVADAFDAMTTDRPYRKAMSLQIALEELWANSGTQFDPEVVRAFFEAFEKDELLVKKGW
ncbi:HD domain-containing phosphohydrolase [Pelotomaculum propionicicum]|uniref:3'3'-cGAMP-specific phosphodiesterase 2 n=1 Tax=Pelotomaculum propionicicum TaxID=258475 RepID=A0A4Y7RXB9_9FIRM|nr:HD domain-containing phosphohydrolase [Pelotomaculum propionicicum]TEB13493.1 3'3'-cGAMP-specific phosphodiesterase 2 [Pelotomaculum propionicicum]